MDDDLNTADAIAAVFELAKDINIMSADIRAYSKTVFTYALSLFDELTQVLGLLYNKKSDSLEDEVEALIEKRQQARKSKDFKTADEIRDKLKAMGIILEDTPHGVKWHKQD